MSGHRELSVFEVQKKNIQDSLSDAMKDKPKCEGCKPTDGEDCGMCWKEYAKKLEQTILDVQAVLDHMEEEGTPCKTCKHRHLGIGTWGPCNDCLRTKPDFKWVNYEPGPCSRRERSHKCNQPPAEDSEKKEES